MKASKRLQVVLKLAEMKQQRAAEALAVSQKELDNMEQQREQLVGFKTEYNQGFLAKTGSTIHPSQLANYQRFYGNLEQVQTAQLLRVESAEYHQNQARSHWQACYAKEQNMRNLVEKKHHQEQLVDDRRLQKEQDDRPVKPSPY